MSVLIDAHMHFWDPRRWDYPWLRQLPAIDRPFLPADIESTVDAVIFVEAGGGNGDPEQEVTWVEELAARSPVVAGILAHAPLEHGADAAAIVERLGRRPLIKGIRRNLQDEPAGFAVSPRFRQGVGLLAAQGLVADLCVRDWQLPEVTELAKATPHVTFVLNHAGKPGVRSGQWQPWADDLARLAELPNVFVKLSGLATEANWLAWTQRQVAPYLAHALAAFGSQRCMFGGDWPVSTLATGYGQWRDVVADVVGTRTPAEQALVFSGVAQQVYGLEVIRGTATDPR
ncbi:amidohydrolase family protein [Catelliglobosispora koreensis]|uniref:amidohydrolase family protein n=1 Tax=Catelliglobosispora koreensis TaxID=129052 RepID=UPI00035E77D4|nr:amidohydrolase family protein [Catelliglobosispora koreensis]